MKHAPVDPKEFDLPDTTFVRDIENRVFQAMVLRCLSDIEGVSLIGQSLLDNFLWRKASSDAYRGIHVEQDGKNHSVAIRLDLNIRYGLSLPEKAEEIQCVISETISGLTGLRVSSVHVVFKNLEMDDEGDCKALLEKQELEDEVLEPSLSDLESAQEN